MVRSPLVWLGEPDPVASMMRFGTTTPRSPSSRCRLVAWIKNLAVDPHSASLHRSSGRLSACLNSDLNPRSTCSGLETKRASISSERLGRWLRKVEGKIVNGLH